MTDKDRYELKIAGLLHDCGKVTTPVHVVDKATKLRDDLRPHPPRRHALRGAQARRRDRGAARQARAHATRPTRSARAHERSCASSTTTASSCTRCNIGGERMRDEDMERVQRIAALPLARRARATRRASSPTTR